MGSWGRRTVEGPEADRSSAPVSSGSSAAPVPLWPFLGVTLGVERIVCQARSSGRGASGPRDCSGGQGGCGEGQHGWPGSEGASRGREDSLCHHCSKRPEGGAQAPLLEPGQVSAWSGRTPGSWSRPVSPLPPALRPQFPTRRQCRGGRRPVSLEGGEAPRVQIGPPLAPWLGTGVEARALLLGPVRWPEDRCSGCRVRQ